MVGHVPDPSLTSPDSAKISTIPTLPPSTYVITPVLDARSIHPCAIFGGHFVRGTRGIPRIGGTPPIVITAARIRFNCAN